MEGLLRHAIIARGIEFSRHQYDTTAMEDIAEKSVKFMHRHYVFLNFKLIVRFDFMITFMSIYFCGTTNGVSCNYLYELLSLIKKI